MPQSTVSEVNPVTGGIDDDAGPNLDVVASELVSQRDPIGCIDSACRGAGQSQLICDAGPVIFGLTQQIDNETLRAFDLSVLILCDKASIWAQIRERAPYSLTPHQEGMPFKACRFPTRTGVCVIEHKPGLDHQRPAFSRDAAIVLEEKTQRSI